VNFGRVSFKEGFNMLKEGLMRVDARPAHFYYQKSSVILPNYSKTFKFLIGLEEGSVPTIFPTIFG